MWKKLLQSLKKNNKQETQLEELTAELIPNVLELLEATLEIKTQVDESVARLEQANDSNQLFPVGIKKLDDNNIPANAYDNDAAVDCYAAKARRIRPGERVLIPLGFSAEFAPGHAALLTPRSGLALKEGITILNTPGLIDSGYRNEWGAILINHSDKDFYVKKGDRIAQALFIKVETPVFTEVDELSDSSRGEKGFGSSGNE